MKLVIFSKDSAKINIISKDIIKYSNLHSSNIRIFGIENNKSLMKSDNYFDCAFIECNASNPEDLMVAEDFRKNNPYCFIIVFSENSIAAPQIMHIHPHRYLITPTDYSMIKEALDTFFAEYKPPNEAAIKSNGETKRIYIDKILYLEAQKKYSNIVTDTGIITVHKLLKDIIEQIPEYNFFRIHKSFYVNLSHVAKYSRENVFLDNGEILPLSKYRYQEMIGAYSEYMHREK